MLKQTTTIMKTIKIALGVILAALSLGSYALISLQSVNAAQNFYIQEEGECEEDPTEQWARLGILGRINDQICGSEGGGGDFDPVDPVELTAEITASDTDIEDGAIVRISWSSTGADTCAGSGFDTGGQTSGSVDLKPSQDTNYTVTCSKTTETVNQCDPSQTCCSIRTTGRTDETRGTNNACQKSCQAIGMVSIGVTGITSSNQNRVCESGETRYYSTNTNVRWHGDSARCYAVGQENDKDRSDKVSTCYCGTSNLCSGESFPYTPPQTTTSNTQNVSDSVLVSVSPVSEPAPRPTVNVVVNPLELIDGGDYTVSWTSTNATLCSSNGGNGFSTDGQSSGSATLSTNSNQSHTVTCYGSGGSASDSGSVTVTETPDDRVQSAPDANLSASPASIVEGATSVLSWTSKDATSCTGVGFSTGGATSGSVSLKINSTTNYTVNCVNDAGTGSDSATVTVTPVSDPTPPPSAAISANPSSLSNGGNYTLSWSSGNANRCIGNNFNTQNKTSGSLVLFANQTTSHSVTCYGTGGSASRSTTVTVTNDPSAPTVSVVINPSMIIAGQSATVSWTSTNATSCSVFSDGPTSGSKTVSPNSTTSYRVACVGPGGTSEDIETLTVNQNPDDPDPAPTASISSSETLIEEGDSITVSWSYSNERECTVSGFPFGNGTAPYTNGASFFTVANPGTYTFDITCSGFNGGTANDSVTVVAREQIVEPPEIEDCSFAGQTVSHGSSVTAYSSSSVDYDTGSCSSETRTCDDGVLSGSYLASSCIVEPPVEVTVSCSTNGNDYRDCDGIFTLTRATDPIYVNADNTVEAWYQCGTVAGTQIDYGSFASANPTEMNFTFSEAAQENQFNDVTFCLNSVNALDLSRTITLKVLNFNFVED